MNDDFYIGWKDRAPPGSGRATRGVVAIALTFVLLAGWGLAASQRLIGVASFEWGQVKEFSGLLRADPYPHLILSPEGTNQLDSARVAPLVAPYKFGVPRAEIAAWDGRLVRLRGTRIHRDGRLMIELVPGSVTGAPEPLASSPPESARLKGLSGKSVSLGRQTLIGEIVDSKCWMGVMNPGVLTPHRACAVRCISGGIPPMLLVRREGAPALGLLLTDTSGAPVNERVLGLVAEPVEITGEVERQGDLLVLRADPTGYRRIGE